MKYLLTFVIAVALSANSLAKQIPFNFNIQRLDSGKEQIPYVASDWEFIGQSTNWELRVEKGAIGTNNDKVEFHSVTIYKEAYLDGSVGSLIDKIYTYGVVDCDTKILHIFNEFYTDPNKTIVYYSTHAFGSYSIELSTPNSVRHNILKAVCNKSI